MDPCSSSARIPLGLGSNKDMSSGFVKTAVLEPSQNGVTHAETEVQIESEDVKRQAAREAQMSQRPLFEQLEEQKQKKQDEYDAVTKLIFAPPKALDEEDVSHFESLAARESQRKALIAEQEEHDVAAFNAARLTRNLVDDAAEDHRRPSGPSPANMNAAPPPRATAFESKVQIKRKVKGSGAGSKKKVKKSKSDSATAVVPSSDAAAASPSKPPPSTASSLAMLASYSGSDSD